MTYWDEEVPKEPQKEEEEQPLRYQIVESEPRKIPGAPVEAIRPVPLHVVEPIPVFEAPPAPLPSEVWRERIQRFAANPTRVYATVGVGLGVLFGIAVAAVSWHASNPTGPYDLGTVVSSAAGLNGHLFLRWDKKLQYRLTFVPGDASQLAGFSVAAASAPHPLSVTVQLKDAQGFVLCSKDVLLKYDPQKAAALAVPDDSGTGNNASGEASKDQAAPGPDFAKMDADEAAREKGKDTFQNQIGPDGQIASISAEGDFPCSASAYESTSFWGYSTNFPSLAEQAELRKREQEVAAEEASESSATHKKRAMIQPAPKSKSSAFYIEGDDSLEGYDAATGTVETFSARRFLIDKAGPAASALKGVDFPIDVHYRCDQFANCIITRAGGGVLRAKLKR
jgi:hypothetical protein